MIHFFTAHWKWKFIAFSSSSRCNRYVSINAGMSSVYLMFCGEVWKLMENPKSCFSANENLCLHSNAHNSTAKNQDFSEIKFSCLLATKRTLWKSLKFNIYVWEDYNEIYCEHQIWFKDLFYRLENIFKLKIDWMKFKFRHNMCSF